MHEHSPVAAASKAAKVVRESPHGRGFAEAVETYGDALSHIREHDPAHITAEDIRRLDVEAEQVIEAIERRIESGADGRSVQLELAEAVYGVRRKFEKLVNWHKHHQGGTT